MRAVNLLPDARGEQEGGSRLINTTSVLIAGASLLVILFVFIGFTYTGARGDVSDKRDTLHAVQQQVSEARARQAAATTTTTPAATSDTEAQLAAFTSAATARIAWDRLLDDISRVLPAKSWLLSLTLTPPPAATVDPTTGTTTAAPTTSATGLTATGYSLTNPGVAQVMRRLNLVPMLTNVTLQSSRRADIGTKRAYQFTMTATVVPTAEGQ